MDDTRHPGEIELARGDNPAADGREGHTHLLSCSSCRSAAADYAWLRSELMALMEDVAEIVTVPTPAWDAVRNGTLWQRRLKLTRLGLAATLGAALVVCLACATPRLASASAVASATAYGGCLVLRELPTVPAVAAASVDTPSRQAVTPTPSPQFDAKESLTAPLAPVPVPTAPVVASG